LHLILPSRKSYSEFKAVTSKKSQFGQVRAGNFLALRMAHDILHLRQLVALKWAYPDREVAPFRVRYAGEW
jgi:hypothetical protein